MKKAAAPNALPLGKGKLFVSQFQHMSKLSLKRLDKRLSLTQGDMMDTRIESPITVEKSLEPNGNQAATAQTWNDVNRSPQPYWTSSVVQVGQGLWQAGWAEASLGSMSQQTIVLWQDRSSTAHKRQSRQITTQEGGRIFWQWTEAKPPMDPDLLVDEGL